MTATRAAALAGVVALAAAMFAWGERTGSTAAAPTAVAVVDLERLFSLLDEAHKRGRDLEDRYAATNEGLKKLSEEVAELRSSLEKIPENEQNRSRREDIQIAMAEKETIRKTRLELVQQKVNLDRGDNLRAMYPRVIGAIGAIAEQDGWDLVIVDDTGVKIPEVRSTEQSVMSAIVSRRVLHRSSRVDITEQVAQRLNADFGRSP